MLLSSRTDKMITYPIAKSSIIKEESSGYLLENPKQFQIIFKTCLPLLYQQIYNCAIQSIKRHGNKCVFSQEDIAKELGHKDTTIVNRAFRRYEELRMMMVLNRGYGRACVYIFPLFFNDIKNQMLLAPILPCLRFQTPEDEACYLYNAGWITREDFNEKIKVVKHSYVLSQTPDLRRTDYLADVKRTSEEEESNENLEGFKEHKVENYTPDIPQLERPVILAEPETAVRQRQAVPDSKPLKGDNLTKEPNMSAETQCVSQLILHEQRFTQITGLKMTYEMRKAFRQFEEYEREAALDQLDYLINHQHKHVKRAFGYFCGIVNKYREDKVMPCEQKTFIDFAAACGEFAKRIEPRKVAAAAEFKEPAFYADQQVLVLYMLFNGKDFSYRYKKASERGYVLPDMPRYKAALQDFSANRLANTDTALLTQIAFREADNFNKATHVDFHLALCNLLNQFCHNNHLLQELDATLGK